MQCGQTNIYHLLRQIVEGTLSFGTGPTHLTSESVQKEINLILIRVVLKCKLLESFKCHPATKIETI